MTELVAAQDDGILVEYGIFGLMDLDVEACPRPFPDGASCGDEVVAVVCDNRLDFTSAALDHDVSVRLEAWSGEPPEPDGDWSGSETVSVRLSSGVVQLWSVTMGPSRIGTFAVGDAGRHQVRVWWQGADEAAAMHMAEQQIPRGTEEFLVRFWSDC
ncbi:hypothetical protein AB0C84_30435 [Actinomadura sp. NPDC048955]|uniref:hypothetical protein n=1 Tax=Actinomadura sp. NPDC048955 TaxID=3158228 RepID=UPI0033F53793